jgi:membrane-associated phospholipid phosphatase
VNVIAHRLANGVETQSAFDGRSTPLYLLTALQCAFAAVLIFEGGFTVDLPSTSFFLWGAILAVGGIALRRMGHAAIGGSVEALALLYTEGLAALFLLVPITAFAWPFVDESLAAADALIGFHWPSFAKLSAPIAWALIPAYNSFTLQPALILPALFACGFTDRAWRFAFGFSLALIVCCTVYAFVPSEGVATYFGLRPRDIPELGSGPWHFTNIIHELRAGPTQVDSRYACGLISFPSFHTAGALLFVWAAWPIRILRWLLVPLNILLIVAAVPVGGHYLVDIIGGVAIGALAGIAANHRRFPAEPRFDPAI